MSPSRGAAAGPTRAKKILVLGATGTIGRATVRALVRRGHDVVCFVRSPAGAGSVPGSGDDERWSHGAQIRVGDVRDADSVARDGFRGERFDALVSCLASRTGVPSDAWAIDHDAHVRALDAAQAAGVEHMVLLSAICLQRPQLAFQHAKLAFERVLMTSSLAWTIVRPTAFFKSLSGQVGRVKRGLPYLVFGDGTLTACKPIADDDLADYLADRLDDERTRRQVLAIGGPGGAITPRQQGEFLFRLLGRPARFRQVPVGLLDAVVTTLKLGSKVAPALAAKAELARIGRYYATESMLVLDPVTNRYSASATPSTGHQTLFDHYERLWRGDVATHRGAHSVF